MSTYWDVVQYNTAAEFMLWRRLMGDRPFVLPSRWWGETDAEAFERVTRPFQWRDLVWKKEEDLCWRYSLR